MGVSQDFRQRIDRDDLEPVIYVPYRAKPMGAYAILARAGVSPTSLTSAVRKEIQAIDGELAVFGVATLEENFLQQRWPFRVFGTLFAIFDLIALLLSSVGLYAVMSYSVRSATSGSTRVARRAGT